MDLSLRSGAEVHVESRGEDEDGADYGYGEENPEEDPVKHLSHELPVLNHLKTHIMTACVKLKQANAEFIFNIFSITTTSTIPINI